MQDTKRISNRPVLGTLLLTGILVFAPGCLFTDEFGLRPLQGVPAAQVKQRLENEAGLGFMLGCNYYLARKNGVAFDCNDVDSFVSATVVAALLAPTFAGVEPTGFYRRPSVNRCADRVFQNAFLYADFYLRDVETGSSLSNVKLPSSDDAYRSAGLFAAFGATDCGLQKTGRIVELTEPLGI